MDGFAKKYPALARLREQAASSDTLREEGARALDAFQEAAIRLVAAVGDDVAADAAALWSDAIRAWKTAQPRKRRGRPKSETAVQRKIKLAAVLAMFDEAERGGWLPQGFKRGQWRIELARRLARGDDWKTPAIRKQIQIADQLRKRAAAAPPSRLRVLAGFAPDPEKK